MTYPTVFVDRSTKQPNAPKTTLMLGVGSTDTGARVSMGYSAGKIIFGWRYWLASGSSLIYCGATEENYNFESGTQNLGQNAAHISAVSNGAYYRNGSWSAHATLSIADEDYHVIALDLDSQKGWIGRYRSAALTWQSGDPAAGSAPTFDASNSPSFFNGNKIYAAASSDGDSSHAQFIGRETDMPWAIPAGFSAYDPGSGAGGSGESGAAAGLMSGLSMST